MKPRKPIKRNKRPRKIAKSTLMNRARNAAEAAWKLACHRRDKSTCQMCGAKKSDGAVIQIDHCFTRTCSPLFYDVRNGTALCRACHTLKTYKQLGMDKRVDAFVMKREGLEWWAAAIEISQRKQSKKLYLQEIEDIKAKLDGMFLDPQITPTP